MERLSKVYHLRSLGVIDSGFQIAISEILIKAICLFNYGMICHEKSQMKVATKGALIEGKA